MILRPPGHPGAAFTTALAGDMLREDRSPVSSALGISPHWAWAGQEHGAQTLTVDGPGGAGSGDAMITSSRQLPLAVFTADCAGVILHSKSQVAVVHAGWRGLAKGAVSVAAAQIETIGPVTQGFIGPLIGPCCFEVGEEVLYVLGEWESQTSWGTASVDLVAAIRDQIPEVELWSANACTCCGDNWFSHRVSADHRRMAAIGWIP